MTPEQILTLTAEIVSAYVGANAVASGSLPALIRDVSEALGGQGSVEPGRQPGPTTIGHSGVPAVEIQNSVFPDHLICLEDGRKLRTLKRHLRSEHGMTPHEYRVKWDRPRDDDVRPGPYLDACRDDERLTLR